MDKEIALKILRELHDEALFSERTALETFIPELKESEDEKIRKAILAFVRQSSEVLDKQNQNNMIAWLEKQGDTSEIVNKKKIASDILRGAAINLITWIDYNAAEGNMCLSNMECKDIEDALVSGDWDKIYAYIKKKLEKQREQKPIDKVEPKFKVGDYIERKDGLGCHAKIIFVGGNVYGCEKLIHSEDESPFFEFLFKNQDEFQISSDFKQKPAWSEEDERMCQETIDWFEKKCFPYALEHENPARESIKWLKSLKERIAQCRK